MDEEELVERARRGDRDAFRQLVERHQDDVFYLALGLLRNRDDAEDVVQDVFIRIYKSLGRFRGQARLSTWLYRVTLNACRDLQRKRRFTALQESLGLVPRAESRWREERADADPERAAASGEMRQDVARAVKRLSPAERDVFVLRQFNQLSIRETAEITGRAEGTVKNLLYRALRKLQKELAVYREAEEAI
jgi:RNA polymerase sigma-70 factor (ECF subfamily)